MKQLFKKTAALTMLMAAGLAQAQQPTEIVVDYAYADLFKEVRSEEHTSELQSHLNLVCRLLLEKKKKAATRVCSSVLTLIRQPPTVPVSSGLRTSTSAR